MENPHTNTPFITSRENVFFKKMKSYNLSKNCRRDNVVLVEGKKNYHAALQVLRLRHTLTNEDFVSSFKNSSVNEVPLEHHTILSNHLFSALADTKSPQGIIGVFEIPEQELDISQLRKIVVLEGVQDPGNVGTIIRTAFFLGYEAVLLDDDCAHAYSPKVIRSSMGALFHVPCCTAHIKKHLSALHEAGFTIIGADLRGEDLKESTRLEGQQRRALLFGNEGQGLSEAALSSCDFRYRIGTSHEAAESLNVAVASGIMMYHMNSEE